MRSRSTMLSGLGLGLALAVLLAVPSGATAQQGSVMKAPPGGPFAKVSSITSLPEFIPGLGILYVNPGTLPVGPFFGYDRDGNLVNTVYMVPLAKMEAHENWNGLNVSGAKVEGVDVTFNPGHDGVAEPHYHITLWHVSQEKAKSLK